MAERELSVSTVPDVPVEIKDDEWIISIMADGRSEHSAIPPASKQIQKVISELRKHEQNKGFYDPQMVSIGPYHHGKPELEEVERLKTRVAFEFINESEREAHEFYNKILEVVGDARNCYLKGSTDAYDDQAFAHMMFLDGCFVLYLLESCEHRKPSFNFLSDHLGPATWSMLFVDIILLENQLPFLVLQTLMSTRFTEDEGEGLINNYIDTIYIHGGTTSKEGRVQDHKHHKKQPLHLLELVRKGFLSHSLEKQGSSEEPRIYSIKLPWSKKGRRGTEHTNTIKDYFHSYRSATELKAKGIHFKPGSTFYLTEFSFASLYGYGQLTLP